MATDVDQRSNPGTSMQAYLRTEDDILIFKGLTEAGQSLENESVKSIERKEMETASAIQDFKETVNILDHSLED